MRIFKIRSWVLGLQLLLAALCFGAFSAHAQLTAGKDYLLITPPQPVPPGKNVEVLEFFWYACPHCADMQPSLAEWLKKKPADVTFRSLPAAFDENWTQLARAFYAMEVLGVQEKLHRPLFDAIHTKHTLNPKLLVREPKTLFEWMGTQGVDVKKFSEAYNSFSVDSKAKRSIDTTSAYGVTGTPTLVIDGRYLIMPSMAPPKNNQLDYDRFYRNVEQLIAMARAQRKGK